MKTQVEEAGTLRNRLASIQSHWSPAERRHRNVQGLRRRRELFALLLPAAENCDVAAVGATTSDDWRRLAG